MSASARTDLYRFHGVIADAGGRPDGNFHPKTSVMTTLCGATDVSTWPVRTVLPGKQGACCAILGIVPHGLSGCPVFI
jgi:glutaminase